MPKIDKEKRQRGKKHKKPKQEEPVPEEPLAGPSWMAPQPAVQELDQPFGALDPDLKAYLRSVDLKLNEWRDTETLFLDATVGELKGKELVLATDPECSKILERISHVVDHGAKRALLRALSGSYPTLVKHRFGSHVCQTFLKVAAESLQDETIGDDISEPEPGSDLSFERLLELLPVCPSMLSDLFATHVLSDLLLILSARSWSELEALREQASEWRTSKATRRKHHRIQQQNNRGNTAESTSKPIPEEFAHISKQFADKIISEIGSEDLRRCAFDQVASSSLQALLKIDLTLGKSKTRGRLLELLLPGLTSGQSHLLGFTDKGKHPHKRVATLGSVPPTQVIALFDSMARDKVASHVVEIVVAHVPDSIFRAIWKNCLAPSLANLVNDPVANFSIATATTRLNESEVSDLMKLPAASWAATVASGRTGPLKALIDRTATLGSLEAAAVQIVSKAFGAENSTDRAMLVNRILTLQPDETIEADSDVVNPDSKPSMYPNRLKSGGYGPRRSQHPNASRSSEPTVQGALILQSMLRLSDPHNSVVCEGIDSMTAEARISLSRSPIASRVLDAMIDSPTVSAKAKRKLISSFIGQYHILADYKLGSRVAENLYKAGDPFLREKVARSLFEHEQSLRQSMYGRFLLNHVNIPLLKRSPEEWKRAQAKSIQEAASAASSTSGKRKRNGDEIEEVFQASKKR
ncbi:Nucleolar protein 9 [Tulasnella sp. UAMH 9824]|nr:Nucleolar protein 9 [Tulasnella sp. UAMH 9824]